MQRILFINVLLLISISITKGKLDVVSNSRDLLPEHVGAYHTDAFEILGEKYRSKKPETQSDVVKDIASILAEYCPLEDAECVSNAYQTANEEFDRASRGIIHEIKYPDSFDPKMKELVESIRTSTEEINELNLDEVLYSLEGIREKLEDMTDTNEDHVRASLVGLSVAIESTKLWHSTYYDSEHPLHGMIGHFHYGESDFDGHRHLQNQSDIVAVILADFNSALSAGFNQIFGNPAAFFGIAFPAIGASGAAFFVNGEVDDTDDDEEDDTDDDEEDDSDDEVVNDTGDGEVDNNDASTEQTETDDDPIDDVFDGDVDDFLCSLSSFVCIEKWKWGN